MCAFCGYRLVFAGLHDRKRPSWLFFLRPSLRGHHGPGTVIDGGDNEWMVPRLGVKTLCPCWRPMLPSGSIVQATCVYV